MVSRAIAAALLLASSGCAARVAAAGEVSGVPTTAGGDGRPGSGSAMTAALLDRPVADVPPPFPSLAPPPSLEASTRLPTTSSDSPAPPVSSSEARCPVGMALIDDRFCIDRWEATILVRRGATEAPHSPFEPVDGVDAPYRAVTGPGVPPQGYVSGSQAELACRTSGKRLCSPQEWERACRGPARSAYPYGDRRSAHTCNDDVRAAHPVVEAARRLGVPAEQTWTAGMNLALVNQLPDGLATTGERHACTTPEGVFDMVGNLHEWVADPEGTFRGGFYMDTTQNGEGCAYQTTAHDVGYHDYSTGFRCCAHADEID